MIGEPSYAYPRRHCKLDAGAPPWLWVWTAVILVIFTPNTGNTVTRLFSSPSGFPLQFDDGATAWLDQTLFLLIGVGEILPITLQSVVPIGLLIFASVRVLFVKRRHRLCHSRVMSQPIEAAVKTALPGATIFSSHRAHPLMFVFPIGLGRAAVALCAGFFVLWKRDRQAAELLLQHEAVHIRRGDAQLIGVANVQRLFGWIFAVVFLICTIGAVGMILRQEYYFNFARDGQLDSLPKRVGNAEFSQALAQTVYRSYTDKEWNAVYGVWQAKLKEQLVHLHTEAGNPQRAAEFQLSPEERRRTYDIHWRTRSTAMWAAFVLSYLIWLLTELFQGIIYPIAAVWIAELVADRYATQSVSDTRPLVRVFDAAQRAPSFWHRLAAWFTHPPFWLRRWNIQHRHQSRQLFLLLLVFPMTFYLSTAIEIVGIMAFQGSHLVADVMMLDDRHTQENIVDFPRMARVAADSYAKTTWFYGAVILIWPWLAPLWERVFSGSTYLCVGERWKTYTLAAIAVVATNYAIIMVATATAHQKL